ncbi:nucleotide-binding protein [Cytobacillus praedii]|uniref:nucleotide-binding protein n=1 Tax=Cytobacillus praedii TaxID=1742358 RepID=UPI002E1DF915|nr:nucleotide-binding protein [Cytobacillus praedii]
MDILVLIRESLRDLDEGSKKLAAIMQKCIRIARILNDYEAVAVLKYELRHYKDKQSTEKLSQEFIIEATSNGLTPEQANEQLANIAYDSINRRTIFDIDDNKNVVGLSIFDLEQTVDLIKLSIERNEIPEGLHSLDLFYKLEEKQKIDIKYLESLKGYSNVLENFRNFMYTFLIEWEEKVMGSKSSTEIQEVTVPASKSVFLIHGHDEAKVYELNIMLRDDFKLDPIILSKKPDKGMTLIDKFEYYAEQCSYAFALFTPDDIVENNGRKYVQARPNVVFELGWFVARLGRRNVCLLLQDGKNIEIFSDFQGVIQKRFIKDVKELYREISLELKDLELI